MNGASDWLLLVHAGVTCFLVGLIWTIQIVHYPLFASVGAERFEEYEHSHTRRITWIVAPAMFAELGLALWLVVAMPGLLSIIGVALLGVVWFSTFALQVPAHARLSEGFDYRAHGRLVRTNWLRTAAWSARGVIALMMLTIAA